MTRLTCVNHDDRDVDAVAVLVYPGQHTTIGSPLCAACASCADSACGQPGITLDTVYEEPWCRPHKDSFTGQDRIIGPDIVAIDSDRYRELVAEHGDPPGGQP